MSSPLVFLTTERTENTSPSTECARSWVHLKCIIYSFNYLLKYCRTSLGIYSAFLPGIQIIFKWNSDSVWSRWFWSFSLKTIFVCLPVNCKDTVSQPVLSVHMLLIWQHGCWLCDTLKECVLWRSKHLFFIEEGVSLPETLSKAEIVPNITISVPVITFGSTLFNLPYLGLLMDLQWLCLGHLLLVPRPKLSLCIWSLHDAFLFHSFC